MTLQDYGFNKSIIATIIGTVIVCFAFATAHVKKIEHENIVKAVAAQNHYEDQIRHLESIIREKR